MDNTQISMFTGTSDDELVRTFGLWNGLNYANGESVEYVSTNMTETVVSNPWNSEVLIQGTDGAQFGGDVDSEDKLWMWVNNLNRPVKILYDETDTSNANWSGLEVYQYSQCQMCLQNSTANAGNAPFNITVSGTSNLTTVLKAPTFASQGHFYEVSSEASMSVPVITDSSGAPTTATKAADTTIMYIDQLSGRTLQSQTTW